MNIALILAGGNGSRTEQSIPKQFISIIRKTDYYLYLGSIPDTP